MFQFVAASAVSAIAALGLFLTVSSVSAGTDAYRARARGLGLLSIAGFLGLVSVSLAGAL